MGLLFGASCIHRCEMHKVISKYNTIKCLSKCVILFCDIQGHSREFLSRGSKYATSYIFHHGSSRKSPQLGGGYPMGSRPTLSLDLWEFRWSLWLGRPDPRPPSQLFPWQYSGNPDKTGAWFQPLPRHMLGRVLSEKHTIKAPSTSATCRSNYSNLSKAIVPVVAENLSRSISFALLKEPFDWLLLSTRCFGRAETIVVVD